jgi:type IV pilus assembly protein PilA
MMKVSRGSKGFTLIELLIVIAIIGILAAIAVPAYTGYTTKAKVAGVVNAFGAIKNAVAAQYAANGTGVVTAAAGTDTTSATSIPSVYGVTPPTQYATQAGWTVSTAGVIQATVVGTNSAADNQTITLTPNWVTGQWAWTGTVPAAFIPQS